MNTAPFPAFNPQPPLPTGSEIKTTPSAAAAQGPKTKKPRRQRQPPDAIAAIDAAVAKGEMQTATSVPTKPKRAKKAKVTSPPKPRQNGLDLRAILNAAVELRGEDVSIVAAIHRQIGELSKAQRVRVLGALKVFFG